MRAAILIVAALACGQPITIADDRHLRTRSWGVGYSRLIERYSLIGRITTRSCLSVRRPVVCWECRDGCFDIAAHSARHSDIFVELLGSPEVSERAAMSRTAPCGQQSFDMLTTMIEHHIRDMSAHELVERAKR